MTSLFDLCTRYNIAHTMLNILFSFGQFILLLLLMIFLLMDLTITYTNS